MTIADLCLFAALMVHMLTIGVAKASGISAYDNARPRESGLYAHGWRQRALWAHQNGLEGFAFFAAAVLLAEFRGGPARVIDDLALLFVGLRVAYVAAYLTDRPTMRSMIWSAAFLANIAIFFTPLLGR